MKDFSAGAESEKGIELENLMKKIKICDGAS
jgi:hypothetical protein